MPVSIRNADILFNDSSTQSRSAYPAFAAGNVLLGSGGGATDSTSFVLANIFVALAAGTVRTRIRAQGGTVSGNDPYSGSFTNTSSGEVRLFVNGVAVGTTTASGLGSGSFSTVLQQDISVNAGDVVQLGTRRTGGSVISAFGAIQIGGSSIFQATSVQVGGNVAFTI